MLEYFNIAAGNSEERDQIDFEEYKWVINEIKEFEKSAGNTDREIFNRYDTDKVKDLLSAEELKAIFPTLDPQLEQIIQDADLDKDG